MPEKPQTQKDEEYGDKDARADTADGYRDSIEKLSKPYERTVHFDENGLVITDPLGKGYQNDFTICMLDVDYGGPIQTLEDVYQQLAKIQEEHDDLVIAVSVDDKRRSLTYKVSLKE